MFWTILSRFGNYNFWFKNLLIIRKRSTITIYYYAYRIYALKKYLDDNYSNNSLLHFPIKYFATGSQTKRWGNTSTSLTHTVHSWQTCSKSLLLYLYFFLLFSPFLSLLCCNSFNQLRLKSRCGIISDLQLKSIILIYERNKMLHIILYNSWTQSFTRLNNTITI